MLPYRGLTELKYRATLPFLSLFTSLHLSGDRGFEPRCQRSCFFRKINCQFVIRVCLLSEFVITYTFFRFRQLFYRKNCSLFLVHCKFCDHKQPYFCSIDFNIPDQTNLDEAHQASIGHRIDSCWNHGNPLQSCK